jgi:vacuolar-type H+-ATPase subunit H
MELKDPNLRDLYKEMKKNDIDFSCVKDGKGKYTLFFKGKNAEEMTNAFKKYTEKTLAKAENKALRAERKTEKKAAKAEKKSIQAELKQAKIEAKALEAGKSKVKNRSKGAIDI